jgi:hypothetical protein
MNDATARTGETVEDALARLLAWPTMRVRRDAAILRSRVAELEAALRAIQAVAVMTHSERARAHRLDWLREIEDRARAALAGDGGGA